MLQKESVERDRKRPVALEGGDDRNMIEIVSSPFGA